MRLCVISHSYVLQPGFVPTLRSMAAASGVQLSLITPDRYLGKACSWEDFTGFGSSFELFPVPIILGKRQGTFLYHWPILNRTLDTIRPDVISHDQEAYSLGAGQIALEASRRSVPLSMFVWENLDRELSFPRRKLVKFVLGHCTGLVAGNSEAVAVHRKWGFRGPVEIIPQLGVPTVASSPVFGRRDPSRLQVMFGGRLVPGKGVDCLVRAVGKLRAKKFPVHCTIAGDGSERSHLIALAHSLDIYDYVTFIGPIPLAHVSQLLKCCDVLALPSRITKTWKEQLGHVLLEAMAEATITVGTRTGAIPEVIDSDDLLFDEDDDEALANLLERLATDSQFFDFHQKRLWNRAQTEYLDAVLTRKRLDFYRGLSHSYPSGTTL